MQRTYSKPNKEWQGFRPVAYSLHKAWELPLTQISGEGDQRQENATTVGKVLSSLSDQQSQQMDSSFGGTKITTASGTVVLSGSSFNRGVAEVLLGLQKDGITYFETQWFWYDKDHATDDLMASYIFFVVGYPPAGVHGKAIVREQVSFCDYSDSGFDPSMFEPPEDSPIWSNDPEWDGAWARYWYRKFYTETQMGQLMTLREDHPQLHYFEGQALAARGRTTQESRAVIPCTARGRWFPPRASSGRAQRDLRNGLPQAEQKAQELRKHSCSTVVPLPRRARSQQFPQN